jgi:hypothetical protein
VIDRVVAYAVSHGLYRIEQRAYTLIHSHRLPARFFVLGSRAAYRNRTQIVEDVCESVFGNNSCNNPEVLRKAVSAKGNIVAVVEAYDCTFEQARVASGACAREGMTQYLCYSHVWRVDPPVSYKPVFTGPTKWVDDIPGEVRKLVFRNAKKLY